MNRMTAYCGLECSQCPSFIATQNDDDAARARTAEFYAQTYGFDLTPEAINCEGCLAKEGRLLPYCRSCAIRKCCSEKGLATCAHCDDHPCELLTALHGFSPAAKASFERLKQRIDRR